VRERSGGLGRSAFELKVSLESAPEVCAVCRFVAGALRHQIDILFYESVNDVQTRDRIRRAGGVCRYHAELVAEQADALGTAIIMQDLLNNEWRALEAGTFDHPGGPSGRFGWLLDGGRQPAKRTPCPLCEAEGELDQRTVDSLLEALGNAEFAAAFAGAAGLCVPHFHLAFERCKDEAQWRAVLTRQREALHQLAEELGELARTYDYRSRVKPTAEEARAWRRGLRMSSGWLEE